MQSKKKRMGLVLASIYSGSAQNMWTTLVHEMSRFDYAFYIFPGGKLNSAENSEYLRNSIYPLANAHNLDCLVSWGSSIGSFVPLQELSEFHKTFSAVPYVTIGHKMADHACVKFDAYSGMAHIVRHFLEVHKTTKIAFIRGPTEHASSMERYRAFYDVMAEAGYYNSSLVSDPFQWSKGEDAACQLYKERKLIPGRDFEVLIGASDLMTFSAVKYLDNCGFNVPGDYTCAGFNDSAESRILGFTTVHMPYNKLGLTALSLMNDIMNEKESGDKNIVLPADFVVRESCGCSVHGELYTQYGDIPSTPQELSYRLSKIFRLYEKNESADIEHIVDALVRHNEELLFSLLEHSFERFFGQDMDIRLLYTSFYELLKLKFLPHDWIKSIEIRYLHTISSVQNRISEIERYKERLRHKKLNALKCDLLAARSRDALCTILACHLPSLDIERGALVLTENDVTSVFVGGFNRDKRYTKQVSFPAALLLPKEIRDFDSGVFLIQPLFTENMPIGYFICSVLPVHKGSFLEDLRSVISSALSGVFLFEEALAAKQQAEKAEKSRTDFFASVSANLLEPSLHMAHDIEHLQSYIMSGKTDTETLAKYTESLKTSVERQITKTSRIIDFAMLKADKLPFKKHLFHIESILKTEQKRFPLLYGDPEKLKDALDILKNASGKQCGKIKIEKTDRGIKIDIMRDDNLLSKTADTELAWSILEANGAFCEQTKTGYTITYPWPMFSCKAAPAGSSMREWNADTAPLPDWVSFYAIRDESGFAKSAFLCTTDMSDEELNEVKDFAGLFEKRISAGIKKPVVFIGSNFAECPLWVSRSHIAVIPAISELYKSMQDTVPSALVFDTMDCDVIESVRKHPAAAFCPIFVIPDEILDKELVFRLMKVPHVVLCNRSIAFEEEFASRVRSVLVGGEILPSDTGALVKKAVLYFNIHYNEQIFRWKLADAVHVSEDYLTRIFHKEIGLSPWEYLNHFRVYKASQMLLNTNASIDEISQNCGFQDQTYFCRVFKKIYNISPGKYRCNNHNRRSPLYIV